MGATVGKTLSEMRVEARSLFNEPDPNNSHISETQLNGWANEALRSLLIKYGALSNTDKDIVADVGDITLDPDIITVDRAYIIDPVTSKYVELKIVNISELPYISSTWISDDADAPVYLARKNPFTVLLYPTPSTDWIGQNIRLTCMKFPALLINDTDTPLIPTSLQDIIPHFMAYRAFAQLSMPDRAGMELEYFRSQLKGQREIATSGNRTGNFWLVTESDDV